MGFSLLQQFTSFNSLAIAYHQRIRSPALSSAISTPTLTADMKDVGVIKSIGNRTYPPTAQ